MTTCYVKANFEKENVTNRYVSKILATDHSYLKLNLVIAQNHNQICISIKIKEVQGMENGVTLPGECYWGQGTARASVRGRGRENDRAWEPRRKSRTRTPLERDTRVSFMFL